MNKILIPSVITAALMGAGFTANNIMVGKATEQVSIQVQNALQNIAPEMIQVQRLGSSVNGNMVDEQYALYITIDGYRDGDLPIYLTHSAKVSAFASSVNGSFTVDKDKGAGQEFIKEVTTFEESIQYTHTPGHGEIDLHGEFKFGKHAELSLDTLIFNASGTPEQLLYTLKVPKLTVETLEDGVKDEFSMSNMVIQATDGDKVQNYAFDFTVEKMGWMQFYDRRVIESFSFDGMKWKTNLTNEESATLTADIGVDKFYFNFSGIPDNILKLNLKADISGLKKSIIAEIANAAIHSDDPSYLGRDQDDIMMAFFSAGMKANNIELQVNDSFAKGFINLAPTDYAELRPSQRKNAMQASTSSQAEFVLEKSQLENFPDIAPMVEHYFNLDQNNNYIGTFEFKNSQATINGKALF